MGYLKKYRINFKELEIGTRNFTFEIGERFFEHFEKSEIQKGELVSKVVLRKEERLSTLDIRIKGGIDVMCDRCLEHFKQPVEFEGRLYIKSEAEMEGESEDVIKVPADESHIDLAQYFYESIHLALPFKRVHPDDEEGNSTCDREMLELIEKHQQNEREGSIDPRWEKLKNINLKRN